MSVVVGVGKFQMRATLNARWMELCSSVCLCMYVIVSLLFCLCLCEVGQRRGQCGRGEIPKAAASAARWTLVVGEQSARSRHGFRLHQQCVQSYYRAVREVYGALNTHTRTTLPCLGPTLGPQAVWVSGCATLPLVPSWSPPSTQPGGGQRVEKKRVPGTYGVLSQITPLSSRYLFVASLKYTS